MEDEGSASIVSPKTSGGVTVWMESMFMTMSQTFVGLSILKLFDYCLNVAEKSAQWSLPSHEISCEENGKLFGKFELVRPLPWMFFLPALLILRIIRGGLNVGAFIFGYPRVEPIIMVKFLQKCRRRLRSFHLKATKASIRRGSKNKDKILTKSIRLSLSTLFCMDSSKLSPSPPPIKMLVSGLDFETAASPDEKSTTESVESPILGDAKRKFSQVSSDSESETIITKLENCALDDSMADSDFNPAKCSAQSSTSSSGAGEEGDISLTELEDIKKDNLKPLIDSTGSPNALPLDKTTNDMEAEGAMAMNKTRVESPELENATTTSSQTSSESDSETILTKLDNCALDDSMEDSDFNPAKCSAQSSTSSSEGGEDKEISLTELEDIKKDNQLPLIDSTISPNALPVNKTTSDKETEGAMAMNKTRVESPDTEAAPPPPPTRDVTDVEASQKRNEKPNQRPNQTLDEPVKKSTHNNASHNQEKKYYQRNKKFYKHHAK